MIHRAFGTERAASLPPLPDSLELGACYRYCEALARSRHHNFPVASMFVPERLRGSIMAIYAFARTADDFADEPQYEGKRAIELDRWEDQLDAMFHGEAPTHPVFVALADTIDRFDLPITPFSALMSGFRSDLEQNRFATYHELRGYTAVAAEPIGQLYLYLAGYRDADSHRLGEELSSGLALANFWQDITKDVPRGRIYVPSEDLLHFGVGESDLAGAVGRALALRSLIRFEVARTRALFERARPLVDAVKDDIAVEIAMMWLGGMRILDKIHTAGETIAVRRPQLSSADKAAVVARAVAWRGGSLAKRATRWLGVATRRQEDDG